MLTLPKRVGHALAAADAVSLAVSYSVALLHAAAGGDVRAYGAADDTTHRAADAAAGACPADLRPRPVPEFRRL